MAYKDEAHGRTPRMHGAQLPASAKTTLLTLPPLPSQGIGTGWVLYLDKRHGPNCDVRPSLVTVDTDPRKTRFGIITNAIITQHLSLRCELTHSQVVLSVGDLPWGRVSASGVIGVC